MVAFVRVTESSQITIPVELRRKHNSAKGDRVIATEDERGRFVVTSNSRTASDLEGIFSLLPGVDAGIDFGDVAAGAHKEAFPKLEFSVSVIAARCERAGHELATFDRHFADLPFIQLWQPETSKP
jgi:bifunctional DNA-binding transcriptional regulator/antitoxin component of YhaV-PrlF toxin-antitoxin module